MLEASTGIWWSQFFIIFVSILISFLNKSKRIGVIEQENNVAHHTSGRNTGKVHAPYLYNPEKKKLFANAAFHGYEMWKEYSKQQNLPFKEDGVIEVAQDEKGIKVLEKYLPFIDYIVVMSVEPGFGGQGFIPSTLEKISSIDKTLKEKNLRDQIAIQVDGGIKLHNAKEVIDAGADILVAGSEVFKSENPSETIDKMYNLWTIKK